jgi:hypothetical protein
LYVFSLLFQLQSSRLALYGGQLVFFNVIPPLWKLWLWLWLTA